MKEDEVRALHELERLWGLPAAPSIACPSCGKRSYNANDVNYRYCGYCHQFHDDMLPKDVNPKTGTTPEDGAAPPNFLMREQSQREEYGMSPEFQWPTWPGWRAFVSLDDWRLTLAVMAGASALTLIVMLAALL
jgi:hypothetical protein